MKNILILLLLLINISLLYSASESDKQFEFNEKILQLTDQNFEQQLTESEKEDKVMLVMFYAPWCGHCKRLKTTWNEIAEEIVQKGYNNITLVAINCDKESVTSSRMRISGFPTVYAFYQGKNYKFKDRRTKEILLNFAFYEFNIQIRNTDAKKLPTPPSTMEIIQETIHEVIDVFIVLIKSYPYISACVVLVFAFLFGFLIKLIIDDIREAKQYDKFKEQEQELEQQKKDQ